MLARALRLYYTLKPLKPIQVWGLVYYRLIRRLLPFKVIHPVAVHIEAVTASFPRYQPVSWLGGRSFVFLNQPGEIAADWQAPQKSLLWQYNLQYLDGLHALGQAHSASEQAALIRDWWRVHAPVQGVAWDPYPASLRAVNLCKWHWQHNQDFSLIAKDELGALLARHYVEIRRKLEFHLQANHLFANLKALWFLQAALPEYRTQDAAWLQQQVARELAVQFDADGGHFELSPMYHRIMLWDLLDMLVVAHSTADLAAGIAQLERVIERALIWCQAMAHPDTEVAFFNDSTMGIAPKLGQLIGYAVALDFESLSAHNGFYSGYLVHETADSKLICDVAAAGPGCQPGHAHADTLSFELSIGKQRVLVNSGVSEYGAGPERLRQRSTAAHNTVVLEGKSSSDVWSGFRLGKAAKVFGLSVEQTDAELVLSASHDGYAPALHERQWQQAGQRLLIRDSLNAAGEKKSYFYVHPDIEIVQTSTDQLELVWSGGSARMRVSGGHLELVESRWHPSFGSAIKNMCCVVTWRDLESEVSVDWSE